MSRSRGIAVAVLFAALTTSLVAQQPGMLGFPADAVAEERQREEAFRTVPDAERLRADVKTMSAGPHHAGSPGSRAVAEYALQQLRAAGLNAWIEEVEAYMPMPA